MGEGQRRRGEGQGLSVISPLVQVCHCTPFKQMFVSNMTPPYRTASDREESGMKVWSSAALIVTTVTPESPMDRVLPPSFITEQYKI